VVVRACHIGESLLQNGNLSSQLCGMGLQIAWNGRYVKLVLSFCWTLVSSPFTFCCLIHVTYTMNDETAAKTGKFFNNLYNCYVLVWGP
jgi:hypothetical protein